MSLKGNFRITITKKYCFDTLLQPNIQPNIQPNTQQKTLVLIMSLSWSTANGWIDMFTVMEEIYDEIKNGKENVFVNFNVGDANEAQLLLCPNGDIYILKQKDIDDPKSYNVYDWLRRYISFHSNDFNMKIANDEFQTIYIKFETNNMRNKATLTNAVFLQFEILLWSNVDIRSCSINYFNANPDIKNEIQCAFDADEIVDDGIAIEWDDWDD